MKIFGYTLVKSSEFQELDAIIVREINVALDVAQHRCKDDHVIQNIRGAGKLIQNKLNKVREL